MKTFVEHLREPLVTIKHEPYQFYTWLFVIFVFGLAGVWMPYIYQWLKDQNGNVILLNHIRNGSLASFGVVILADGLASTMIAVNAGLTKATAGIRGLIGAIAVLLIMINVSTLIQSDPLSVTMTGYYILFQLSILLLTTVIAIYLYCFKTNTWEKSAEDMYREEDKQVNEIKFKSSADQLISDDNGVKL